MPHIFYRTTCSRLRAVFAAIMLAALTACSSSNSNDKANGNPQPSAVASPLVTPATGGYGRASGGLRYDVTQFGYEEREYFFEGTAETFPPAAESSAPYRSRMIVWTPKDPSRFNGTTVVEWAHVSVGDFDLTYELKSLSPMLEAQGFAFVLVSAQAQGVCGTNPDACSASSLRGVDPERYASLNHPGADYSFDIFNQALHAIKYPSGTAPLGNLVTRFIIAGGFQPQSDRSTPVGDPSRDRPPFGVAGPLNGYLASEAADARLADAFYLNSAAPLVEPAEYPAPTLHHLDESAIRRVPAPNSRNHVTWEVIGATHLDPWSAAQFKVPKPGEPAPLLSRAEEEARRANFEDFGQAPGTVEQDCVTLYPAHYTKNAAVVALREWLETGVRAPEPPHAERVAIPPETATMRLSRDSDGNAIGGLRSPIVQVPVASYNGEGCLVTGTMTPFLPERLAELYPTHQSYVEQLKVAVDEAVTGRMLLCHDAEIIMRKASASLIGGSDAFLAVPDCAL